MFKLIAFFVNGVHTPSCISKNKRDILFAESVCLLFQAPSIADMTAARAKTALPGQDFVWCYGAIETYSQL